MTKLFALLTKKSGLSDTQLLHHRGDGIGRLAGSVQNVLHKSHYGPQSDFFLIAVR